MASSHTTAEAAPTCRRGHIMEGANAVVVRDRARCRACKRAVDQIRNNPDTLTSDDMDRLAAEKYRDILAGRTAPPRPARKKAAPARKAPTATPVVEQVDVREAQRRMPYGIKQYLRTVGPATEALEDAPAGVLEWLRRYELAKVGRRGTANTGPVILNERGRRVAKMLQALVAGQG